MGASPALRSITNKHFHIYGFQSVHGFIGSKKNMDPNLADFGGLQLGGDGPVKCGLPSPRSMGQIDQFKEKVRIDKRKQHIYIYRSV